MTMAGLSMSAVQAGWQNFTQTATPVLSAWAERSVEVLGKRENVPILCTLITGFAALKLSQVALMSCAGRFKGEEQSSPLCHRVVLATADLLSGAVMTLAAGVVAIDAYSRLSC